MRKQEADCKLLIFREHCERGRDTSQQLVLLSLLHDATKTECVSGLIIQSF